MLISVKHHMCGEQLPSVAFICRGHLQSNMSTKDDLKLFAGVAVVPDKTSHIREAQENYF